MSSRPFPLGFRASVAAGLGLVVSGLFGACSTPKSDREPTVCSTADDCAKLGEGFDCQLGLCIDAGVIGEFRDGSPLPRVYPEAGNGTSDASTAEGGGGPVDGGPDGPYEGGNADAEAGWVYPPSSALDPHAARRQELLAQYCGLLETHSCLDYAGLRDSPGLDAGADPSAKVARCIEKEDIDAFFETAAMGACFAEWEAAATCAVSTQYTCPCEGGACALSPILFFGEGACKDQRDKFWGCQGADGTARTLQGSRAACRYTPSTIGPTFCFVDCNDANQQQIATANCSGPPEGPVRCTCDAKGVQVKDPKLGTPYYFYEDDCAGVARALSEGKCLPP